MVVIALKIQKGTIMIPQPFTRIYVYTMLYVIPVNAISHELSFDLSKGLNVAFSKLVQLITLPLMRSRFILDSSTPHTTVTIKKIYFQPSNSNSTLQLYRSNPLKLSDNLELFQLKFSHEFGDISL